MSTRKFFVRFSTSQYAGNYFKLGGGGGSNNIGVKSRTYLNIFFPEFLHSFLFRKATGTIFQRSKHSCWNIFIVTLFQNGEEL